MTIFKSPPINSAVSGEASTSDKAIRKKGSCLSFGAYKEPIVSCMSPHCTLTAKSLPFISAIVDSTLHCARILKRIATPFLLAGPDDHICSGKRLSLIRLVSLLKGGFLGASIYHPLRFPRGKISRLALQGCSGLVHSD